MREQLREVERNSHQAENSETGRLQLASCKRRTTLDIKAGEESTTQKCLYLDIWGAPRGEERLEPGLQWMGEVPVKGRGQQSPPVEWETGYWPDSQMMRHCFVPFFLFSLLEIYNPRDSTCLVSKLSPWSLISWNLCEWFKLFNMLFITSFQSRNSVKDKNQHTSLSL